MRKFLIGAGLIALIGACGNPQLEKVEALKKEAIAVHDEVMPRMGEIHDWSTKLKELKKSIAEDTNDSATEIKNEVVHLVVMLDSADEAMMSWMHDYEVAYEKEHPADSAIVYYEHQIKLISEVKQLMNTSIENAKNYFESH